MADALDRAMGLLQDWMAERAPLYASSMLPKPKVQIVMPDIGLAMELQRALRHATSATEFDFGNYATDGAAGVTRAGLQIEFVGPTIEVAR